jgi:zinc protease
VEKHYSRQNAGTSKNPDRSRPPAIHPVANLKLPPAATIYLDNRAPVFISNMGTQEVTRIEVVFNAGRPFERKPLAARAAASLLREGTRSMSSAEIAENLDYYGAELSFPYYLDTCNIAIVALNKHLNKVLPVFADILSNPLFPPSEFDHFIQRNKERLLVELSKNDVIAYREITEKIFGKSHPYGYNSFPETYDALHLEDVQEHYARTFTAGNCFIFVAGNITEEVLRLINLHLGPGIQPDTIDPSTPPGYAMDYSVLQNKRQIQPFDFSVPDPVAQKVHIHRPDTLQTAIRIGKRLFHRGHPDYHGFFILNTLLGGYFGSRLMNNIREEKGYTYNIYSALETMRLDGYFYIASEVGNEVMEDTLEQIYGEIEALQQDPVGQEELEMAKSYLLGLMLNQIDGPFNHSDLVRSLISDYLPLSFFETAIEAIHEITPAKIQNLAQKYLQRESLTEVIVGP